MALNSKQQAFVEAYCCNGFNATQAAITAGYSERTAYSQGQRLLKHVEVQEQILAFKAKASEKALVTIDDVVKGFLKEAEGNADDTTAAARNAAWKELSNYTGGFDANRQKVDLNAEVTFNMDFTNGK